MPWPESTTIEQCSNAKICLCQEVAGVRNALLNCTLVFTFPSSSLVLHRPTNSSDFWLWIITHSQRHKQNIHYCSQVSKESLFLLVGEINVGIFLLFQSQLFVPESEIHECRLAEEGESCYCCVCVCVCVTRCHLLFFSSSCLSSHWCWLSFLVYQISMCCFLFTCVYLLDQRQQCDTHTHWSSTCCRWSDAKLSWTSHETQRRQEELVQQSHSRR